MVSLRQAVRKRATSLWQALREDLNSIGNCKHHRCTDFVHRGSLKGRRAAIRLTSLCAGARERDTSNLSDLCMLVPRSLTQHSHAPRWKVLKVDLMMVELCDVPRAVHFILGRAARLLPGCFPGSRLGICRSASRLSASLPALRGEGNPDLRSASGGNIQKQHTRPRSAALRSSSASTGAGTCSRYRAARPPPLSQQPAGGWRPGGGGGAPPGLGTTHARSQPRWL